MEQDDDHDDKIHHQRANVAFMQDSSQSERSRVLGPMSQIETLPSLEDKKCL